MQMVPCDLSGFICHHVVECGPVVRYHVRPVVTLSVTVMEGDLRVGGTVAFGKTALALRFLASVIDHQKGELTTAGVRQETHLERSAPPACERIRIPQVCLLRRFHLLG